MSRKLLNHHKAAPLSGLSTAAQIADRIEAALARIEAAANQTGSRADRAERRAALLERHGHETVAALDALLANAAAG